MMSPVPLDYAPPPQHRRQSRRGIASLVIAVANFVTLVSLLLLTLQWYYENPPWWWMATIGTLTLGVSIVGLTLAIAGLRETGKAKIVSLLGLLANCSMAPLSFAYLADSLHALIR